MLQIPTDLVQRISREQAWHYQIVPMAFAANSISFYHSNSLEADDLSSELSIIFGLPVHLEEIEADVLKNIGTLLPSK